MAFKYVGKKVETSELRLDKNVFFEKAKSIIGFKRLTVDTRGRVNNEIIGRRTQTLPDDNTSIATSVLIEGLLVITTTSDRTKDTPTATQLIDDILDADGEAIGTASYEAFEFSVINRGGSNTITLSPNTGVASIGNMTVAASSSGRFQIIKTGSAAVTLYRLA